MKTLTFLALVAALIWLPQVQQQPNQSSLKMTQVAITPPARLGQVSFYDEQSKPGPYFDIWRKESSTDYNLAVLTYIQKEAAGGFSATWGKGPIEKNAFAAQCLPDDIPSFDEKTYWAARVTVIEGRERLRFDPIEKAALDESGVKALFEAIKHTLERVAMEDAHPVVSNAPRPDQTILLSRVNNKDGRTSWYRNGWLRPQSRCIRYLRGG